MYPYQYQPQPQPVRQDDGPKGFAITSMVLGICSLVIPYIGIVTAILAIVFCSVSRSHNDGGRGMAIAGLVCGIGALVLWVSVIIAVAGSS